MTIGDAYPEGRILEAPNLVIFTFAELRSATRNFKPDSVLGEGGFGRVYKGWVDEKTLNPTKSGIGMIVAVKKLNPESLQGLEEWQVSRISKPKRSFINLLDLFIILDLMRLADPIQPYILFLFAYMLM